jgi:hypothetical protein
VFCVKYALRTKKKFNIRHIRREVCTKGEESEASRMVANVGGCVLSEVRAEKEETGEHWAYNTLCSVTWEMGVKKMLGVKNGIRS